jgi:hypothetical protein
MAGETAAPVAPSMQGGTDVRSRNDADVASSLLGVTSKGSAPIQEVEGNGRGTPRSGGGGGLGARLWRFKSSRRFVRFISRTRGADKLAIFFWMGVDFCWCQEQAGRDTGSALCRPPHCSLVAYRSAAASSELHELPWIHRKLSFV